MFMAQHLRQPFFDPEWHAQAEYQLFMVLQGTGTRFVGDSIQSFQPGELVFTGPHLPHIWRCEESYFKGDDNRIAEGLVVYFGEDFPDTQWMTREECGRCKSFLCAPGGGSSLARRNLER